MSNTPRTLVFGRAAPANNNAAMVGATPRQDLDDETGLYADEDSISLTFKPGTEGRRLRRLNGAASDGEAALFGATPNWAYRGYIVHATAAPGAGSVRSGPLGNAPPQPNGSRVYRSKPNSADEPEHVLCLFNVLVALEWQPTADYLRQLRWAFRRASDFLYDVTDGRMAFGQVVFGGPALMPYADIQIMASSRIHPRAWVDGLHKREKYTPIRLGRGLWPSRNGVVIAWDEPEGYRTIVHEWGHYALGLRDQYFERRALVAARDAGVPHAHEHTLVTARAAELPSFAVLMGKQAAASESIMATLEGTSELVPCTSGSEVMRKSAEWNEIEQRFPWLNRPERPLEGPGRLPLPLPLFQTVGALQGALVGADPALLAGALPAGIEAEKTLVFLLRGDGDTLIAQGGPDARFDDDGLALLGAQIGDRVVLVGRDSDERPAVHAGTIGGFETRNGIYAAQVDTWEVVTPRTPIVIDVIPDEPPAPGNSADVVARVRVQIGAQHPAAMLAGGEALLFVAGAPAPVRLAFGAVPAGDGATWTSAVQEAASLDGHVLVRQGRALSIVGYSHGGNPPSSTPANAPPISAGSSDSSVMLFFDEDASGQHDGYSRIKVVTTVDCGARARLPHPGAQPFGAPASLCANAALPAHLSPTLLLRYEQPGERELLTGDILICRLVGSAWVPMPTYLRPGTSVAAMPMTAETAGSLLAEPAAGARVERFQLFWVPRV